MAFIEEERDTTHPPKKNFCPLAVNISRVSNIYGDMFGEEKIDGLRVLTLLDPGRGQINMYNRRGELVEDYGIIRDELRKTLDFFDIPTILDGELVDKRVGQKEEVGGVEKEDILYYVFDIVSFEEFRKGVSERILLDRIDILSGIELILKEQKVRHVRVLERIFLQSIDLRGSFNVYESVDSSSPFELVEEQAGLKELISRAIERGWEGLMLKYVDGLYDCRRTNAWIKLKVVMAVKAVIQGFRAGTGKNKGKLGSLLCEGVWKEYRFKVNVGSGLSQYDRENVWQNKKDFLHREVEVACDKVAKNEKGEYYLKSPRFLKFRKS